jgi:hypothetical protein
MRIRNLLIDHTGGAENQDLGPGDFMSHDDIVGETTMITPNIDGLLRQVYIPQELWQTNNSITLDIGEDELAVEAVVELVVILDVGANLALALVMAAVLVGDDLMLKHELV